MNNLLVSVIIPNYCHAKYLDQRIRSVINQTYQNFEVIILDDASSDDGASKTIIESYRSDPHVVHIEYNETNSGSTFKQWRKGFDSAKGDLIWIAESDDYCEVNFLEELVSIWTKYPNISIVQSSSCRVDSDGRKLDEKMICSEKIFYEKGLECIKNHLLCSNFYIPNASAVLFRKNVLNSIPQDYVNYQASGDRLFWIYLAENGDVVKVDKPLNYFRQHNNKVSSKKEYDGTQCRENYRINRYLHSKGYVKNKYRFIECNFYWSYINKFDFVSNEIKQELLELWFGKYFYKSYFFRSCFYVWNLQIRLRTIFNFRTLL